MKTKTLLLLSFSLIICTACSKKDDNDPSGTDNQSITTAGVISGTIDNYVSGEINNLKCKADAGETIGKGAISSTGTFSITLPANLDNSLLTSIWEDDDDVPAGVTISDPSALGNNMESINAYKDATELGWLRKSNSDQGDYWPISVGDAVSRFFYVNKSVTIKGSSSETDTYNGVTDTYNGNYNLTLKKGWNEFVQKMTAHSINSSGGDDNTYSFTNDIPSDMKWRYCFNNSGSGKRNNVNKLRQHTLVGLFLNRR